MATTATFAAIMASRVGTAVAARTDHASFRSVGVPSNRRLLWVIALEALFTAALICLPQANRLMGHAPLSIGTLVLIAPFPLSYGVSTNCALPDVATNRLNARGPWR